MKEILEVAVYEVVVGLIRVMPEAMALALGSWTGAMAGILFASRRRAVLRHLRWAFPDRSPRWYGRTARASWRHLGRELAAVAVLSRASRDEILERTRFVGMERLEEARRRGKGAILFTAHIGNWELGAAAFVARGVPFDAVAMRLRNRRLNEKLQEARARVGTGVIDIGAAVRKVPRALKRGRVVAVPSDQSPVKGGAMVPFFGRAAATPVGAAVFSRRLGAPALFAYALRDAGNPTTYTVFVEPLGGDDLADSGTGGARRSLALLGAYHAALENAIRRAPEQYFWQHLRWKPR